MLGTLKLNVPTRVPGVLSIRGGPPGEKEDFKAHLFLYFILSIKTILTGLTWEHPAMRVTVYNKKN
jgi:hypothetical protein